MMPRRIAIHIDGVQHQDSLVAAKTVHVKVLWLSRERIRAIQQAGDEVADGWTAECER